MACPKPKETHTCAPPTLPPSEVRLTLPCDPDGVVEPDAWPAWHILQVVAMVDSCPHGKKYLVKKALATFLSYG